MFGSFHIYAFRKPNLPFDNSMWRRKALGLHSEKEGPCLVSLPAEAGLPNIPGTVSDTWGKLSWRFQPQLPTGCSHMKNPNESSKTDQPSTNLSTHTIMRQEEERGEDCFKPLNFGVVY